MIWRCDTRSPALLLQPLELLPLSWIWAGPCQFLVWVFFFCAQSGKWLKSTNVFPHSKGLTAAVMRGVKGCCRCGHPQDNSTGSYYWGDNLDNCRPEAHFRNLESWWSVCFWLVFLIFQLDWWKYGIDSSKCFYKMKQDELREQVN